MITRQVRYQLLAFLLLSAVGLTYTGVRYAGLGRFLFDQGYTVSATFADSGGIFDGAEVTYRGVTVGKVGTLSLVPEGVQAELKLRPGTQVPTDVQAVVANRSAVGEQFIDLRPQRDGKPYLQPGASIPVSATSIPISPTELVVNLDDFVTSINLDDLGIVLDELGKAFDGAGSSLQTIVDQGDTLTKAALDALPETKRLINDGKIALDTQRDVSGQFKSFNADLNKLTATLRSSDQDFRNLYANGTRSANELTDLIRKNDSDLPVLLSNLVTVAQIQKVRLPAIRQILVTYPNVVAGGFTVVPGDGTTHFGLVSNNDPPICTQGYEGTNKRSPMDVSKRNPNYNAGCTLPRGSTSDVRGAKKAPGPNKQSTSPSRTPNTGEPASADSTGYTTSFGDYNPRTGQAITADGQQLSIGSTGGADKVFGADSWQWLLLGPLSAK